MTKRVLVVDDQPELRKLVRLSLEMGGYEVFEADSGQRCLELLRVVKPALIVMDAMMPGRYDGFQACQKVKEAYPDIKVVMLTARAQQADRELAARVNSDAYITKPFSPMALLEVVKEVFG